VRILLALLFVLITAPTFAAGLGFNPFEKGSPTSATGPQNQGPSSTSSSAQKSASSATPVAPPKPDVHQPAKNQAVKK
jgi:uncharacterized protein YdeI (BOF family)